MSSLHSGEILLGSRWNYRVIDAVKGDSTHASTIFKAGIVPYKSHTDAPQWFATLRRSSSNSKAHLPSRAIIKAASPDDATATENLEREYQTYRIPDVASAVCFREIYDATIGDDTSTPYLALEWRDTTLAEVKYRPDSVTYALIREVLKATLNSCVILDGEGCVNTGMVYLGALGS
ncbi:hypothetical protein Plec18167_001789 [Paecilomyces lecythidis]|uniref:Fungal-type protein kinase domain-containing protein n=1 Tax=Paecilomyces lecythidis TaxID=3004212 RepID=A0ABR3YBG0_9EURO